MSLKADVTLGTLRFMQTNFFLTALLFYFEPSPYKPEHLSVDFLYFLFIFLFPRSLSSSNADIPTQWNCINALNKFSTQLGQWELRRTFGPRLVRYYFLRFLFTRSYSSVTVFVLFVMVLVQAVKGGPDFKSLMTVFFNRGVFPLRANPTQGYCVGIAGYCCGRFFFFIFISTPPKRVNCGPHSFLMVR